MEKRDFTLSQKELNANSWAVDMWQESCGQGSWVKSEQNDNGDGFVTADVIGAFKALVILMALN